MVKVLLVEDDDNLRKMYKAKLLKEGYQIIAIDNGSEAVDTAFKERPDIILLDIMLPGIDGFEVLAELRADPMTMETPVIFLTNYGDAINQERGLGEGAEQFLLKVENTPESVIETVKKTLILKGIGRGL